MTADCGSGVARPALSRTRGTDCTTTASPVPTSTVPTSPVPTSPVPASPVPPALGTLVPGKAERGQQAPTGARHGSADRTPVFRTLILVTMGTSFQERRQLAHGHVGSLRNAPGRGQQFFNLRFSSYRGGSADQALLHHGHHQLAVGGENLTAGQAPSAVGHGRLLRVQQPAVGP